MLVLEDLHWADPTSHALVGYLARATQDAPILLVLTYRADEAPPGSSLDGLRHELARERLGEELRLEPLGPEDVAAMLRDILRTDPGADVAAMVYRASGGNPFVVEELVRDAVAIGTLDPTRGRWDIMEPIVLPGTVQEMLLRRMRALDDRDREVVRWAAVLGERFDADLLAAAAGVSEEAALQALGRLREAGLVADTRVAADARLAFRHALTRQAVLGGLLAPERQRRHARVLEIAGGTGGVRALPLDEALEHALGAGDRVRSLQFSIRAAGRAVELGGYAEARAHYERALALWDAQDGLPTRADLLMRLGYLTSHVGGGFLLWMQAAPEPPVLRRGAPPVRGDRRRRLGDARRRRRDLVAPHHRRARRAARRARAARGRCSPRGRVPDPVPPRRPRVPRRPVARRPADVRGGPGPARGPGCRGAIRPNSRAASSCAARSSSHRPRRPGGSATGRPGAPRCSLSSMTRWPRATISWPRSRSTT